MNFLKKHYEKVALLVLFVIFAALLVYLYTIIQATQGTPELEIPAPPADYQASYLRAESDEFNLPKTPEEIAEMKKNLKPGEKLPPEKPSLLETNMNLEAAGKFHDANTKDYSDLMSMYKIVRCKHDNCNYLIPRRLMEEGQFCPRCKNKLEPPKDNKNIEVLELDTDEDGIPDRVELEAKMDENNKLNPKDGRDADYDLDGDGFSNIYEYRHKTKMNDPKDHPPLYYGLYIVGVERQKIKATLMGITPDVKINKRDWYIQIEVDAQVIRGRKRSKNTNYYRIGRVFETDTGSYEIADILSEKIKKKIDGKEQEETEYYLILKDTKDRKIEMRIGQKDVFDPEYTVTFKDVWDNPYRPLRSGRTFRMGNSISGRERYFVQNIEKKGNELKAEIILRTHNKKKNKNEKEQVFTITQKPIMPVSDLPREASKEQSNDAGASQEANMPPENAPRR